MYVLHALISCHGLHIYKSVNGDSKVKDCGLLLEMLCLINRNIKKFRAVYTLYPNVDIRPYHYVFSNYRLLYGRKQIVQHCYVMQKLYTTALSCSFFLFCLLTNKMVISCLPPHVLIKTLKYKLSSHINNQ